MGERRMFTGKITESDAFLDMPLTSQCLYFHLNMYADDEGFVKNPKRIQRMIGASDDDLKVLIAKNFVLIYESGVIVIKHWKMHNVLRKDRIHETEYVEEKSMLYIKENGAYTLDPSQGEPMLSTKCQPNVNQMSDSCLPQYNLTKDKLTKENININNRAFKPPTVDEVREYCVDRANNVDPESFVNFYESKGWMVGKNKMKDWKAAVRTWEKSRKDTSAPKSKPKFETENRRAYDYDELMKSVT